MPRRGETYRAGCAREGAEDGKGAAPRRTACCIEEGLVIWGGELPPAAYSEPKCDGERTDLLDLEWIHGYTQLMGGSSTQQADPIKRESAPYVHE